MSKIFKKQNLIAVILIAFIGLIIYANSLFNSFIWDDYSLVVNNQLIRSFDYIKRIFKANLYNELRGVRATDFYRPVQNLTYTLDYRFFGLNPFGYHLSNILFHILNALLVYCLIFIMAKRRDLALITGLLFVVHPVHTEAVTYIAGRADLLVALFMLLSMIFFVIYPRYINLKKNIFYILSLFCFILALLSKELAIILPLILLLYDFSFSEAKPGNLVAFLKRYSAFLIVDLIYISLRLTTLHFASSEGVYLTGIYPFYSRLIIFLHAFNIYFRVLFFPLDLHMCRIFVLSLKLLDPVTFFSGLSFLLSVALIIYAYKKSRLIFFGGLWYLILLFPQSGFYPINAFMADHFLYLPSIGFFFILSIILTRYLTRKLLIVLMITLLGFYSTITIIRNYEWRNPGYFYRQVIERSPYCLDAYVNLGVYYRDKGQYEQAEKLFKKAVDYKFKYYLTGRYLADVYAARGKYDEAIAELNKILNLVPGYQEAEVYNNLGYIYQIRKSYKEAADNYKRALEIDPDLAMVRCNLASAYLYLGKTKESFQEFEKVLGIEGILTSHVKPGPSEKELKEVLRQKKEYIAIFTEFASLFSRYNRFDIAEKVFQRTIALAPNNPNVYFNLGVFYYSNGLYDKARSLWQSALRIDPRHLPSQEWLKILKRK